MNIRIPKRISAIGSACMGGLLFLAGCFNGLEAPEAPVQGTKNGLVTISIGEEARTVLPDLGQFDELELVITPAAGGESVYEEPIVGGQATVYLDEGTWDLQVNGYVGNLVRATATNTLINQDGVISGNTRFSLAPVGTGTGILQYQISKPAEKSLEAGSRLALSRADGSPVPNLPEGFSEGVLSLTDSKTGTVELDPGRYQVEIALFGPDGAVAAVKEIAVILPGLRTEVRFEPGSFEDPAFLAPLSFGTTALSKDTTRIGAAGGTASTRTQAIYAAGVQDEVYFTLGKTSTQTVSVAEGVVGVTQGTTMVDGTTPGPGLAVFTVDTSSIRYGGYREFTLKVTETEKESITIAVTVGVGQFGLFQVVVEDGEEGSTESLDLIEGEDNVPISNLKEALTYLSDFAEAYTTYEIHLDKDEEIPPFYLFSQATGITLRLRGIGGARTVSWDPNESYVYTTSMGGLFSLNNNTTLELDHIILDGKNVPIGLNNLSFVFMNALSDTLVLKEGTKLTNFVASSSSSSFGAVIVGQSGSSGNVIMEGGEISGNQCNQYHIVVKNFTMNGGSIRNNNSRIDTLIPFVNNAINFGSLTRPAAVQAQSFTMMGGEIRDNGRTSVMSGVIVTQGESKMIGGTIEGNGKYKAISGGGVIIAGGNVVFTMTGGTIRDNSSLNTYGNGIFIYTTNQDNKGQFILNGSVTLEGRIALMTGTPGSNNVNGSTPAKRAIVTVGPNFTNTVARPITLDIYAQSTSTYIQNGTAYRFVEDKTFITANEVALEDALKGFTYGDYIEGLSLASIAGNWGNSIGLVSQGLVSQFFTVDEKTGVLTHIADL
jgi:hypothetical protein